MILRWCLLQLWWIMNNDLLSRGVDGGHIRTTRAADDTKCKRHFSISSPAVMMSAWPQPAPSSDWSKESFWRRGETLGPFHTCAHFCGGALANQSTHTHTHTHRRMARRERAKRYLAFKRRRRWQPSKGSPDAQPPAICLLNNTTRLLHYRDEPEHTCQI